MTVLGDYLTNFYRPGDKFERLNAVVHWQQNATPGNTGRRPPAGRRKVNSRSGDEQQGSYEFWAAMPDRVRVESLQQKGGREIRTLTVSAGETAWKQHADGRLESSEVRTHASLSVRESLPTEFRRHFDEQLLRRFFASLTLEGMGEYEIAGRQCVVIRAIPVANDRLWPHWLPSEADEFEFAGDLERGSLLRIVAKADGVEFQRQEVTSVDYDADVEDEHFECKPPEGQAVEPADPVTRIVDLEEAISRLPYPILLPGGREHADRYQFHLQRRNSPDDNETLMVCPSNLNGRTHRIFLSDKSDSKLEEDLEWETIESELGPIRLSDPEVEGGQKVLLFAHEGATVVLFSDEPRDQLVELAKSFERVN
ncbi:hypothetical protein [Aeoliella sp.]|uniref:hypothetical protein n=1 Tax=Aeoliella sp. TaxID=2795800 RepID=UPI003CCB8F12